MSSSKYSRCKNINPFFFSLCILSLSTANAFAGHPYIAANAGVSMLSFEKASPQITYYDGLLNDTYYLHSNHHFGAVLGLQAGYEFLLPDFKPTFGLGLGFYGTPIDDNSHYKGTLIETPLSDPPTELYDFKFHTYTTRLMLEMKMLWKRNCFMPYIDAGVGTAWVTMDNYKEKSSNNIYYPALPSFYSRINTNFAFQVGVGLGYQFGQERISLGYRYANLGHAKFRTRGEAYPYKLNFNTLESNEIYFDFVHLL